VLADLQEDGVLAQLLVAGEVPAAVAGNAQQDVEVAGVSAPCCASMRSTSCRARPTRWTRFAATSGTRHAAMAKTSSPTA
jgi:hypothetical protein